MRLTVALLAILLLAGVATPVAAADKVLDDLLFELQMVPLEGTAAPFELERLGEGKKVTLAEQRGRPVMLYFWATWCPYCTRELPSTIEKVHQDYKDAGLVVLPISIEEGRRKVTGWAPSRNLTMPLLLDPDGDTSRVYRVTATPTVVLIGRDGSLIAKALGTKPWTSGTGRALLQHLLKK